ncbi:hypothetical protein C4556_00075 [Candidatus Parcubacteria bacterium]|nr:MAG: hypothetical protein C4556_00075 [Candidatus Parcubacteria bacterium]
MSSQLGSPKGRRGEPLVDEEEIPTRNRDPGRRAVLDETARLLRERPPLTMEEIEAIKKSGTFPLPKSTVT